MLDPSHTELACPELDEGSKCDTRIEPFPQSCFDRLSMTRNALLCRPENTRDIFNMPLAVGLSSAQGTHSKLWATRPHRQSGSKTDLPYKNRSIEHDA
jgi:hypothetical protein